MKLRFFCLLYAILTVVFFAKHLWSSYLLYKMNPIELLLLRFHLFKSSFQFGILALWKEEIKLVYLHFCISCFV